MFAGISKIPWYKKLLKILPWIVAACILVFLFSRIDRDLFIASVAKANLYIYIPLVIFFIFVWFFIESQNLMKLYQFFGTDVSYPEMVKIRGATFLLMVINYGLGAGGIAMYMKKFKKIPFFRSMSLFFFYMVVESAGIAFLAMFGYLLSSETSVFFNRIFLLCTGLFIFYNAEILLLRYMPDWGFLKKINKNIFMVSFKETNIRIYIKIFILRVIYFSTFIIFFYFAIRAFHMHVPLLTLTALVPIIFFIGNLPITPFGLGTIQAAMLFFFKDYGTEANILALSILYTTSLMILRSIIGLYYLKIITGKDLLKAMESVQNDFETAREEMSS